MWPHLFLSGSTALASATPRRVQKVALGRKLHL
jgi:hypothetical protein